MECSPPPLNPSSLWRLTLGGGKRSPYPSAQSACLGSACPYLGTECLSGVGLILGLFAVTRELY